VIKSHSIILNLSQPSKVITLIPTDDALSNWGGNNIVLLGGMFVKTVDNSIQLLP
jgi:hypothetical protein